MKFLQKQFSKQEDKTLHVNNVQIMFFWSDEVAEKHAKSSASKANSVCVALAVDALHAFAVEAINEHRAVLLVIRDILLRLLAWSPRRCRSHRRHRSSLRNWRAIFT